MKLMEESISILLCKGAAYSASKLTKMHAMLFCLTFRSARSCSMIPIPCSHMTEHEALAMFVQGFFLLPSVRTCLIPMAAHMGEEMWGERSREVKRMCMVAVQSLLVLNKKKNYFRTFLWAFSFLVFPA